MDLLMDTQERLLLEMASELPRHIHALRQGLNEEAFVEMLFEENLGGLMLKLKTISSDNAHLLELWNCFFERSVESLADWYAENGASKSKAVAMARQVLTELSVHSEAYSQDFQAFQDLLQYQKPYKQHKE